MNTIFCFLPLTCVVDRFGFFVVDETVFLLLVTVRGQKYIICRRPFFCLYYTIFSVGRRPEGSIHGPLYLSYLVGGGMLGGDGGSGRQWLVLFFVAMMILGDVPPEVSLLSLA